MTPSEEYETLVKEAMLNAKKMQDFLWGRQNGALKPYDRELWVRMFQKRVDKIAVIDPHHPNARVELRKRLLQQAALSLQAILGLYNYENPESDTTDSGRDRD